jgi:hypothetical protein
MVAARSNFTAQFLFDIDVFPFVPPGQSYRNHSWRQDELNPSACPEPDKAIEVTAA